MAIVNQFAQNQAFDQGIPIVINTTTTHIITETTLGNIEVGGIEVYVIRQENGNNDEIIYITLDLEDRIPIGVVVRVPGYNDPFIYFDEMEGPRIFQYFDENIFHQSLNWIDINIGTEEEVEYLKDLFQHTINNCHRILNEIIVQAQDRYNEQMVFTLEL